LLFLHLFMHLSLYLKPCWSLNFFVHVVLCNKSTKKQNTFSLLFSTYNMFTFEKCFHYASSYWVHVWYPTSFPWWNLWGMAKGIVYIPVLSRFLCLDNNDLATKITVTLKKTSFLLRRLGNAILFWLFLLCFVCLSSTHTSIFRRFFDSLI